MCYNASMSLLGPFINYSLPKPNSPGCFGALRKYDIHTGYDIYVPTNTTIFSMFDGIVVNIEWFTGEFSNPPTPWWLNTKAVWVKNLYDETTFVYGEIEPCSSLVIGNKINKNDSIGKVLEVLKTNKNKNLTSMIHIEKYSCIPKETVIWNLNDPKPIELLDPTTDIIRNLKE